jgi:hypothetical protein
LEPFVFVGAGFILVKDPLAILSFGRLWRFVCWWRFVSWGRRSILLSIGWGFKGTSPENIWELSKIVYSDEDQG